MPIDILSQEAIPAAIISSRPLAEVHRLDLALFVAFEEASSRLSAALAPSLPDCAPLAEQARDDARHHAAFRRRLALSLGATHHGRGADMETNLLRLLRGEKAPAPAPLSPDEVAQAVVIPPLRRFFQRCDATARGGSALDTVTLLNLVLKGTAAPLYAREVAYWRPVDPALADFASDAGADEARHVAHGMQLVRVAINDPARRASVAALFDEGRAVMREVSRYYVRKFVASFCAVARRAPEMFVGAELTPGRLLAETPEEEQATLILALIDAEHAALQRELRL